MRIGGRQRKEAEHLAGVKRESLVAALPPVRVLHALRHLGPIHDRGLWFSDWLPHVEAPPR